jgi:phosphatidylinositol glycan class B
VAALILLVVRDPKNPYLWCFLPFFAVHSLIAHKEMRFLFPMAFLAAAIWMSAFLLVEKRWKERRILWSVGKVLMVMIIAVNVLGLTVNMSKGAGNNQKLYLQKYINSDLKEKDVNIIYTDRYEPYEESEVNKGFYKLSNATMRKYTNINDLEYLTRPEAVNLFVCSKKDLKDDIRSEELKAAGWEFLSQSVPVYAEKILAYYPHYNTEKTYVIFRHAGDSYNNGMKDK